MLRWMLQLRTMASASAVLAAAAQTAPVATKPTYNGHASGHGIYRDLNNEFKVE